MASATRVIGTGINGDAKIQWMIPVTRDINRTRGCENICREGCAITNTSYAWIRHVDHDTTRTRSRGGRRMIRTDPHVTVYMSGTENRYEYEGHLFLVYDRNFEGKVPKRMAGRQEMRFHTGPNPELYAYNTHPSRLVSFPNALA